MEQIITLSNGTRAGIVLTQGLAGLPQRRQTGLERPAPTKDVPIVFYVPNRQALDRILSRFGPVER